MNGKNSKKVNLEDFEIKEMEQPTKQNEQKTESKELYREYFSLGEGKGIRISVFKTHLRLERVEKIENKYQTTQEIALAPQILEKLYIRLPKFFELMKVEV